MNDDIDQINQRNDEGANQVAGILIREMVEVKNILLKIVLIQ